MIHYTEAAIDQLSIHKTGNQAADEPLLLSETPVIIQDEALSKLLMQYFLSPFEKPNEVYHFAHSSGNLSLNEVYHFAKNIFEDRTAFHLNSQQIAKQLYSISNHPKI